MEKGRRRITTYATVIGTVVLAVILVLGTVWMGQSAGKDTKEAVHSVSLMFMDELAGRREQVVENNLQSRIRDMRAAINMMDSVTLSSPAHLQEFQASIKQMYNLEKFAFADEDGLVYTAGGTLKASDEYTFAPEEIGESLITVRNLDSDDKTVVIVLPVDIPFEGKTLKVCFMEIGMKEMLAGVSLTSGNSEATFCNIYTAAGVALSNAVLGGLAQEDNLLDAMQIAEFEDGYSYEAFREGFSSGQRGEVSFTYNGIQETLSYVPVKGTDWLLTYLIRESVISDRISSVSDGMLRRSIVQSIVTVAAMLVIFGVIIWQNKRNAALMLEKEAADVENRVKREEMEQRLKLQEKLLEEEKQRSELDNMITAMASDYRSVYHVDLDTDDAVCYRGDPDNQEQYLEGTHFPYYKVFAEYCEQHVTESYREGFMHFIDPEEIREGLAKEKILAYRYLAERNGREYYEMIRAVGVRTARERADDRVHAVGIGFTVIDAEMRETMAQQRALSDALAGAEQASKAKTAFLSSMSHEIRTPMNAIIGLGNIAMNVPDTPPKTIEYLEKMEASAEHLLGLINDILDMSRIESGRMTLRNEEFSFRKLLEAINVMFSSQCQDKGLGYHCRIVNEVDDYYIGDNMKLRQVLINILGNAVKFTPEGGNVELLVERRARFGGKTTLMFTVSDTGIGMSPEFLPHIFDSFAQEDATNTNKYGSSGLGLAITKNIVEMMNGTIRVESEKGKGSTFEVTVTLTDSSREPDKEEAEETVHPDDMTVLVVDDDPIACEHAQVVLGKAGIACETALSGRDALEMVKLRHARMEPYNLILMDWQMPEMDGVETTRQIREETGDESAIIILTAYRWDDILEEAIRAGVDSFISKPLFAAPVIEEFKAARKRRAPEKTEEKEKAELSGKRVLLAEDVQINAEIIIMLLEARGVETEHAENGKIVTEMFAGHPEGYYDAILMDLRMPEMDGLEATRVIRAMDRADAGEIPIIALTANAFDEDVQRSLQAGLNAHLSKPIQPEILYETLENLIRA